MASRRDLHVRRDQDREFAGVAKQRKGRVVSAVDLTDASLHFAAREHDGGPLVAVKVSGPGGDIVIDSDQVANKGAYQLLWHAADTADTDLWPEDEPRTYPYELTVTTADGTFGLSYGSVKYAPDDS